MIVDLVRGSSGQVDPRGVALRASRPRLCLGLALACCVGGVARADVEGDIQGLLAGRGIGRDTPGVAVLVVAPKGRAIRVCRGLAVIEDKTPITPRTTFELASVSKPMTATAILILQERGKLSVDDDVRKHIPELPKGAEPTRIRDLLQHVSGLPNYMDFEVDRGARPSLGNADYVAAFADKALDFPSRQKYEYNNTNYMLLGVVIERVSGRSYGTFMREAIFEPAGMEQAGVYERPEFKASMPALGYSKEGDDYQPTWGAPPLRNETFLTVGDGGVWCSLSDMLHFETAIRGGKLLKPETWKLALSPSKTRDKKTNQYGLGWDLYPTGKAGLNGFGHGGSWSGFRTSIYRDLLTGRTTVILSNRADFDPDELWGAMQDVLNRKR